jgi:hypothetical protein
MSLLNRIAVGLAGNRKEAATVARNLADDRKHRSFNGQMEREIAAKMASAAGDDTAAWQVDMSQMMSYTGE